MLQLRWDGGYLSSQPLDEAAAAGYCVVVIDHARIDYARLVQVAPLIVDTRNVLKGFASEKIVRR